MAEPSSKRRLPFSRHSRRSLSRSLSTSTDGHGHGQSPQHGTSYSLNMSPLTNAFAHLAGRGGAGAAAVTSSGSGSSGVGGSTSYGGQVPRDHTVGAGQAAAISRPHTSAGPTTHKRVPTSSKESGRPPRQLSGPAATSSRPLRGSHDDPIAPGPSLGIFSPSSKAPLAGEERLIDTLVQKALARLATRTDQRLPRAEFDRFVRQSCNSLLQMCRTSLSLVVSRLLQELDRPMLVFGSDEPQYVVATLRHEVSVVNLISVALSFARSAKRGADPGPSNARDAADPPQLDEHLARNLLNTIGFFFKQSQAFERAGGTTSSLAPLSTVQSKSSLRSGSDQLEGTGGVTSALMNELSAHVAKIVSSVSASNWPVVLARLRNRLTLWSGSAPDEHLDRSETRLLEHCSLNRHRLGHVMRELAASFMHLKRPVQVDMAMGLRRAIWNWIVTYPDEYSDLVAGNGRLDGAPDSLFDLAAGMSHENVKKRTYLWPLQTMLLVVCPDILNKIASGGMGGRMSQVTTRKAGFVELLRKNLKASKSTDVAATCCIDLIKAATFAPNGSLDEDEQGLRLLATDLIPELGAVLLSPSRPLATSTSQHVELLLTSEYIATIAWWDKKCIGETLLQRCLSEGSQSAFQLAFIEGCHMLAAGNKHASWNATLEDFYLAIANPLRKLFMLAVGRGLDSPANSSSGQAAGLVLTGDEHSERNELLRAILNLWRLDRRLAFYRAPVMPDPAPLPYTDLSMGGVVKSDNLQQLVYCITRLLDHRNHSVVRMSAIATLRAFYGSVEEKDDNPGAEHALAASRAWLGFVLYRQLMECWMDTDEEREVLNVLEIWCTRLEETMTEWQTMSMDRSSQAGDRIYLGAPLTDWPLFGDLASLVCPLTLCTVDPFNLALAVKIFRKMHTLAQLPGFYEAVGSPRGVGMAPTAADRVDAKGLPEGPHMPDSRAAQAKKARLLMRYMNVPQLRPAIWDEALRRWKALSVQLGHQPAGEAVASDVIAGLDDSGAVLSWISYSVLLAMLASADGLGSQAYTELKAVHVPRDLLPTRFSVASDRARQVDRFIQDMVDLLVADNLHMREGVKDSIGTELSPELFPMLLRHLKSVVSHFFEGGRPRPQPPFTHFIEQAIAMLRMFCDRMTAPLDAHLSEDIGYLLLDFCRYAARLGSMPDSEAAAGKIKYWLAHVFELSAVQGFIAGEDIRNGLADYILSWAADVPLGSCLTLEEMTRHRAGRDLLLSCLKSLSLLLKGLKMRPRHVVGADDAGQPYPRTYHRFHEFLSTLLFTISRLEAAASQTRQAPPLSDLDRLQQHVNGLESNVTVNIAVSPQQDQTLADLELSQLSNLREHNIACLANLMSSNLEPAYRYINEMGFSPDLRSRRAHLQVLQTYLQESAALAERKQPATVERGMDRIVELMCQPDFTVAIALCDVCPANLYEEMSEVLLNLFSSRGIIINFLMAVVENEVINTQHESTLFRGNSFATRLLTLFARTKGYDYLRETLARLLLAVSSKPAEFSIEYDPYQPRSDSNETIANLEAMTEAFLETIKESWTKLPVEIREVCHHIATITEHKFPNSMMTAVGGFVFLRLINPSIIAPDLIDLDLPQPARETQRSLVMITRVLQQLANNIRFGAKDPSTKTLNEFMTRNMWGMAEFLQNCAHAPDSELIAAALSSAQGDQPPDEVDYHVLHSFIHDYSTEIGQRLMTRYTRPQRRYPSAVPNDQEYGNRLWGELTRALNDLGDPAASEPDLPSHIMEPSEYIEFVDRRELRRAPNPPLWRSVFFRVSAAGGRPAFVFLAAAVKSGNADLEGLLLHTLHTLDRIDRPYTLFIDCTGFATSNEIPTAWLKYFFRIIPSHAKQNLADITFVNPNTLARRYLHKVMGANKWERHWTSMVRTITDLNELDDRLPNYRDVLPFDSWRFHEENRAIISQVTLTQGFHGHIPVRLMIGSSTLLICSAKPQEFVLETKCTLNEVINIGEVEEIRRLPQNSPRGPPGFTLRVRSRALMRFVSPQTDHILHALDLSAMSPSLGAGFRSLSDYSSLSDVQGAILNCVLRNLCSLDPETRSSAFGLLQSFVKKAHCDGLESVFNTLSAGHLPQTSPHFIGELSERLCHAFPKATLSVLVNFFASLDVACPDEIASCGFFLKPWLLKVPDCLTVQSRAQYKINSGRIRHILRGLVGMSLHEDALYSLLHSRIWPYYARYPDIVPLIIDELTCAATAGGSVGLSSGDVCEIGVSASSADVQGKVLARLRKILVRTSLTPVATLVDSSEWPEIVALTRIELGLAFNAPLSVSIYLPEILYVSTMLVGAGPTSHRQTVHALLLNVLSSLLAASRDQSDEAELRQVADDLSKPSARAHFGLGQSNSICDDRDIKAPISFASLEHVVACLTRILDTAAPCQDAANRWRTRWVALLTSTCFQLNPALQCRAFIALGQLATGIVEEDLFFQVVAALRPALRTASASERDLATAVLTCAAKLVSGLSSASLYPAAAFWIGVALMIGADPAVYAASLKLARTSLGLIFDRDQTLDVAFSKAVVSLREEACMAVWDCIEDAAGLRFEEADDGPAYFGFSMVAVLVKGLRHGQTSPDAEELLRFLMAQSVRHGPAENGTKGLRVSRESQPYFAALLPLAARQGRLGDLFHTAYCGDDEGHCAVDFAKIVDSVDMYDRQSAVLVVAVIVAMLQTADSDPEIAFCFGFLAEMVERNMYPDVLGMVQEELQLRIHEILRTTEDACLAASCQILMFAEFPRANGTTIDQIDKSDADSVNLDSALLPLRLGYLLRGQRFSAPDDEEALEADGEIRGLCIELISALLTT